MRTVILAGPRHRGWGANKSSVDNKELIQQVLQPRKQYYGEDLNVVSIGCDLGFGKEVKEFCEEEGIKFLEYVVYFNGPRKKEEYALAYQSRHAALMEIGDEFHITVSQTRRSSVEDLVERVSGSGRTYALYDDHNNVIEYHDAECTELPALAALEKA